MQKHKAFFFAGYIYIKKNGGVRIFKQMAIEY